MKEIYKEARAKIAKRKEYYWIERVYTELIILLLPWLKKTPITPNMVTFFNMIVIVPLTGWCAYSGHWIVVAMLIQVYLLIDILDGNLARYKEMCSPLGQKVDIIADEFFYVLVYGILVYSVCVKSGRFDEQMSITLALIYIVIYKFYGLIATHYILPRIRKLQCIRRFGIKRWCYEHNIIFGMDTGMEDVMMTVALIVGEDVAVYTAFAIGVLYMADLIYRIVELKINMNIESR